MNYIPENPSIESPKLHTFLETLETFRAYFVCPFPSYSNRSRAQKVLGLSRNGPSDRRSVITHFGCLVCFDSVWIHCSGDELGIMGLFYFWAGITNFRAFAWMKPLSIINTTDLRVNSYIASTRTKKPSGRTKSYMKFIQDIKESLSNTDL